MKDPSIVRIKCFEKVKLQGGSVAINTNGLNNFLCEIAAVHLRIFLLRDEKTGK